MDRPSKNSPNSKEIIYISLDELLIIHTDQIERYGGSHGIRDIGLLESALYRPQSSFGGEDLYPTLFEKAAVLVHSLLLNHAFIDGNKRTAITSMIIFCAMNEIKIICTQEKLVQFSLNVENKRLNLQEISSWLEEHGK